MNEQEKEKMLELLSDEAIFGLSEEEMAELAELEKNFPELRDESERLEMTAATVGMLNLDTSEPMPAHLRARIVADADKFFAARADAASSTEPETPAEEFQKTFTFERKNPVMQWLGWAFAGFASIALAINIWTTRVDPGSFAGVKPTPTPTVAPSPVLTLTQQREQLLASAKDAVQTSWSDFDPKAPKNVEGDVVWSNSAQKGYVRFRNLPVNDKTKESYQLWIFDRDRKNPVSAGVFDVNAEGEVIVPLDTALKIQAPVMFGVTAENPGGDMVPNLKKVMAVAKVAA